MSLYTHIHTTFVVNIHHFTGIVRDCGLHWVGHVMNWLKALCHRFYWCTCTPLSTPLEFKWHRYITSRHIISYHILDLKLKGPIVPMTQTWMRYFPNITQSRCLFTCLVIMMPTMMVSKMMPTMHHYTFFWFRVA